MRQFLWSMVLTSFLLALWAEVATPIVQRKKPQQQQEAGQSLLPHHKILYLSKTVYEEKGPKVVAAALEWNEATDGQVVFDVGELPDQSMKGTVPDPIDVDKSIIVMNITQEFPEAVYLDSLNNNSTLAYCDVNAVIPYIGLIYDRIDEDDFTPVILHELGHELGLQHPDTKEHPEVGIGSLMYSNINAGSQHITNLDLIQYCKLYHCDASKLHGFSQVQ